MVWEQDLLRQFGQGLLFPHQLEAWQIVQRTLYSRRPSVIEPIRFVFHLRQSSVSSDVCNNLS